MSTQDDVREVRITVSGPNVAVRAQGIADMVIGEFRDSTHLSVTIDDTPVPGSEQWAQDIEAEHHAEVGQSRVEGRIAQLEGVIRTFRSTLNKLATEAEGSDDGVARGIQHAVDRLRPVLPLAGNNGARGGGR